MSLPEKVANAKFTTFTNANLTGMSQSPVTTTTTSAVSTTTLTTSMTHPFGGSKIGNELESESRLPISCRFVPTDQWLTTHVDPTWTVRLTKVFLLARCANPNAPFPIFSKPPPSSGPTLDPTFRYPPVNISSPSAISPVPSTFASASSHAPGPSGDELTGSPSSDASSSSSDVVFSKESAEEDDDDEFLFDFEDRPKTKRRPRHFHQSRQPRHAKSGTMSLSAIDPHGLRTRSPSGRLNATSPQTTGSLDAPHGPVGAVSTVSSRVTSEMNNKSRMEDYVKSREKGLKTSDYVLCSFTTGQSLEDHLPLSSYRLRPNEMLEVQRKHRRVYLPRIGYEAAYFDGPAYVLVMKEKDQYRGDVVGTPITHSPRTAHSPDVSEYDSEPRVGYTLGSSLNVPQPSRGEQTSLISGSSTSLADDQPRQPYRSRSSHFRQHPERRQNRTYENNIQDERDRWKEKDVMRHPTDILGGVSTLDREPSVLRKAHRKAEKEMLDGWMRITDWKLRWIIVRDDKVYMWKERRSDPPAPMQCDLNYLYSVDEVPIPNSVFINQQPIVNPAAVVLRFRTSSGKDGASPDFTASDLVLRIRMHDEAAHEHLLRVLYRILIVKSANEPLASTPTTSTPAYRPPPSSFPLSPSLLSRAMSPLEASTPSKSPPTARHRNSQSLSSNSFSDTHSISSLPDSEVTKPKRPLKSRIPGLRKASSTDLGRSKRSTKDDDATSVRSVVPASAPQSPSSSPTHNRRMSLSTAIRLGPPSASRATPAPSFLSWRTRLLERCTAAGRGEAHLRKISGRDVAIGPWQREALREANARGLPGFDTSFDEDYASSGIESGREEEEPLSEFEWTTWRIEAGFTPVPLAARLPAQVVEIPSSPSISGMGSNFLNDLNNLRRGSVPTNAFRDRSGTPSGTATPVPKRTVVGKAAAIPKAAVSVVTDAVTGRARSKSVITITPQSASRANLASSPHSPTARSAAPSILPSPATVAPPLPSKGAITPSENPNRRGRSSTISSPPQRSPTSPPYSPPPVPPLPDGLSRSSSRQTPIERYDDSQSEDSRSDISLNSALNLPGARSSVASPQIQSCPPALGSKPPPSPAASRPYHHRARKITIDTSMDSTSTLASVAALATLSGMNPMAVSTDARAKKMSTTGPSPNAERPMSLPLVIRPQSSKAAGKRPAAS